MTTISPRAANQVIDGAMLSDANLGFHSKNANFLMCLSGKEHMDWLEVVAHALIVLGVPLCSGHPKVMPRTSRGKQYENCILESRVSAFLTEQRCRWYPEHVKIIPRDLNITPIVLANAYMGDGNSTARIKQNAPHLILLTLSLEGFTKEDLLFFEGKLRALGIQGHADTKGRNGYRVSNTESVNTFMDLVEPYILPSYRYKVKRSGYDYN